MGIKSVPFQLVCVRCTIPIHGATIRDVLILDPMEVATGLDVPGVQPDHQELRYEKTAAGHQVLLVYPDYKLTEVVLQEFLLGLFERPE